MIKRGFDIIFSLVILVLLFPFIFIISILIRIKLGSPVFFTQYRIGKGNKIFKMIKFRTMTNDRDKDGKLLPNEMRVTSFGRALRSTSIDELPELINVIIGNMSLVGPRPLLTRYLPLYNEEQIKRHTVKPGITGWAQINGRNAISWTERFKLDIWYVENRNLFLDLKILFLTVHKVFKRVDISQSETIFMEDFNGFN